MKIIMPKHLRGRVRHTRTRSAYEIFLGEDKIATVGNGWQSAAFRKGWDACLKEVAWLNKEAFEKDKP